MAKGNCKQDDTLWCIHAANCTAKPVGEGHAPCVWAGAYSKTVNLASAVSYMLTAIKTSSLMERNDALACAERLLKE